MGKHQEVELGQQKSAQVLDTHRGSATADGDNLVRGLLVFTHHIYNGLEGVRSASDWWVLRSPDSRMLSPSPFPCDFPGIGE